MQSNLTYDMHDTPQGSTTDSTDLYSSHRAALQILSEYWGYPSFRPQQWPIIHSVIGGHDTLALMPTGGGKSLTFQIPALMLPGLTLVVTPLIALMVDQVEDLRRRGIKAACVHAGMRGSQVRTILDNVILADYKLLYVSPERLQSPSFMTKLKLMDLSLIVVDECHCISQWGYDFRPEYLRIAEVRAIVPDAPVLALTATATPEVVEDIMEHLLFREDHKYYCRSFYRTNLCYVVRETYDKPRELYHILSRVEGSALVYVRTRKMTADYATMLSQFGLQADYFHAGLSPEEKLRKQRAWQQDEIRIMVCTTAFGMGINKPDVRIVVHPTAPGSMEGYYQESGRAGRDNQQSYAVLLYSPGEDDALLYDRIERAYPPIETIREIYEDIGSYYQLGVESGEGAMYEMNLFDFAKKFGHQVFLTRAVLQILSMSGYLQYLEDHMMESLLRFTVTRNELYTCFGPHEEIYDDLVELLLRLYPGLFTEMVQIDEYQLAKRLELSHEQIYELLKQLRRWHIIDYKPGHRANYIIYTNQRVTAKKLQIPKEVYQDRRQRDKQRVAVMLDYMQSHGVCRTTMILRYFGDPKPYPCGYCDHCLAHPPSGISYRLIDAMIELLRLRTTCTIGQLQEHFYTLSTAEVHEAIHFIVQEGYPLHYDQEQEICHWIT